MSTGELNPVSYVVLGLLLRNGPSTPYDLKVAVGRGIAFFWQFPHSQIYAETERLTRLGLLSEEREEAGRRRRTYRITPAGRAAFGDWLADSTAELAQLRSIGLLKLFFGWFADAEDVARLASAHVELFEREEAERRAVLERLRGQPDRRWQLAVAEAFVDVQTTLTEHWKRAQARATVRDRD